jgi:hypothetical protein
MSVKPWTPEECNKVVASLLNKVPLEDVAKEHERSVNSIKYKALAYACDLVVSGKDLKEIADSLGLSEDDLKKEVSRRNAPPKVKAEKPAVAKPPVAKPAKANDLNDILKMVDSLRSNLARYIQLSESK